MRKVIKWIGIVVGALVGLMVLALAGLYFSAEFRFNKTYDITPEPVTIPADAASLEIGKHWAESIARPVTAKIWAAARSLKIWRWAMWMPPT